MSPDRVVTAHLSVSTALRFPAHCSKVNYSAANGGTLFLDEIGDLPLDLQPKLLRVLQEQQLERLGGVRTIHTDVRIIAATNQDLRQMVEERSFEQISITV
jgi:transcriptional regulator with GAF, ATPase, and Fis domain